MNMAGEGLWLYWCEVDGYSTARCACGGIKYWFANWIAAEQAAEQHWSEQIRIEQNL